MSDAGLHRLHMAKSIKELNSQVSEIPKAAPKLLIKTAQRVLDEAQSIDKRKDEERAYILYMRYFSIVQNIQSASDYKNNKKYYDGLLDSKTTVKVIDRAEQLQKSLVRRYDLKYKEKLSTEKSTADKLMKEKENAKKPVDTTKSLPMTNGVTEEGCMTCEKLYSLSKEKCSTYLILDTRPRVDFMESSIKLPNVINIPEEILKPGLTAGRIGSQLEESQRRLWLALRHKVDYLILCDWRTEELPLPQSLSILTDAMVKWDPEKQYKSKPLLLSGGYELWHLKYPILTTNPRAILPINRLKQDVKKEPEPVSLSFEYPDLDKPTVVTPSPSVPSKELPFAVPDVKSATLPSINRYLKPSLSSQTNLDGKNNNIKNEMETPHLNNEKDVIKPPFAPKVNNWERSDSVDLNNRVKPYATLPSDNKENIPFVPSRSLKPKDLIDNLSKNKAEMDKEQELLEETVKVEEDTMQKIQEIQETTAKKEQALDDQSRAQYQKKEDKLNEEIRKLKEKSTEMEEHYNDLSKQNEELRQMVKLALQGNLSLDSGGSIPNQLPEIKQKQEQEQLRIQEDKRKALQEQVQSMRRERKEKEKRLKEKAEEERARQKEAERRQAEERKSRQDAELRSQRNKGNGTGETYTTKLRDSPRSSPVRGGTNLKRSHSAFNLSQIDDEDKENISKFDRSLKPLNTPQRRNINAARQRNFEPKYGKVGLARTGLKNLGNTCYMNSVIQCLNNTSPLAKYFVEGIYSEDINPSSKYRGEIAEEVGAVVRALWCGQYRSIAMWDLKTSVGRIQRKWSSYEQQDAHEFLVYLLEWLQEDLNKVTGRKPEMKEQNYHNMPDYIAAEKMQEEILKRDDSMVNSLFHGLERTVIVCNICGYRSLTFQPFSAISLCFPSDGRCTLRDLLQHHYGGTPIEGYKCSKCGKESPNTIKKIDIWRLPPLLILHLKRFEQDVLMKKKQNFVDFPLEGLFLDKYTAMKNNKYGQYDLYGVTNHYGTMEGGHYTSFCKSVNKLWYKFDDHEVYELSRESVRSSAAYILFYEASSMNIKINNLV